MRIGVDTRKSATETSLQGVWLVNAVACDKVSVFYVLCMIGRLTLGYAFPVDQSNYVCLIKRIRPFEYLNARQ